MRDLSGARFGGIGMDRQVVLLVVWHCGGVGGDNEGGLGGSQGGIGFVLAALYFGVGVGLRGWWDRLEIGLLMG